LISKRTFFRSYGRRPAKLHHILNASLLDVDSVAVGSPPHVETRGRARSIKAEISVAVMSGMVRHVKKDQRGRGRYLGGSTPFGYRLGDGGELIEDPAQQAAIKRMRKLRREGHSLRIIAERMAKHGVQISHVAVQRITGDDAAKAER
jgi:hypothetical protein